jgi:AcrR family transcriptional regulator
VSTKIPEGNPDLPDELARLPHGRHGLPAEFVERNQRERLIASFVAVVGEGGYGAATITSIALGAGVSTRTFYKYFETIEEVYIGAFDKAVATVGPRISEAFSSESEWPLRIRAALVSALSQFSDSPDLARVLTAEPFVAGPEIALRSKGVVEQMVPFLREGRELGTSAQPLPETTERGLIGAAGSLVGRQAFGGENPDFTALLPDLLQFLLTPYLGSAEARKIAGA